MYLYYCGIIFKVKGVNVCKLDLIFIYFFGGINKLVKY